MTLVLHIRDSRRLTGPSRFWNLPSAVLDIGAPDSGNRPDAPEVYFECPSAQLVDCWQTWARKMLDAVGWVDQQLTFKSFHDGTSVLISAPIDGLYSATEINEFAFNTAVIDLLRGRLPDFDQETARLRSLIADEANPGLIDLQMLAEDNGLLFLSDDDHASVGGGTGSRTWPVAALPDTETLSLTGCHNIRTAAVSGTNGKSTTVRLLSAMVQAGVTGESKTVAGVTSTDWVRVGDEIVEQGDYSGPGGARAVLRDQRVDIALLEAARGGLNRRGLGVPRLEVAALTNIGTDHLGEHGSSSLDDLLDVKWTVARVAQHVVLNADDTRLTVRGQAQFAPGSPNVTWFSLDATNPVVVQHVESGGSALVFFGSELVALTGRHREILAHVEDIPVAFGGAARHNVANALAAAATARALGLATNAIERGLRTFGGDRDDNPGRLDLFSFGDAPNDVRVLVDFAHNPEGYQELMQVAENLTPNRLLVSVGQAGDRSDQEIRQLADTAWSNRPDRVLIKELDEYRRGRPHGEVASLIADRLRSLGAPEQSITHTKNEMKTLAEALAWARTGDLVVLAVHSDRDRVVSALTQLEANGWRAGTHVPDWPDPASDSLGTGADNGNGNGNGNGRVEVKSAAPPPR